LWSAFAGLSLDGLAQDVDHFRHIWLLLGLLARGGDAAEPAVAARIVLQSQASATLDRRTFDTQA
jgi:hypothetical protein